VKLLVKRKKGKKSKTTNSTEDCTSESIVTNNVSTEADVEDHFSEKVAMKNIKLEKVDPGPGPEDLSLSEVLGESIRKKKKRKKSKIQNLTEDDTSESIVTKDGNTEVDVKEHSPEKVAGKKNKLENLNPPPAGPEDLSEVTEEIPRKRKKRKEK